MRKALVSLAIVGGTLTLLAPPPASAVAKEIIQLQRDVALLQQQVRDLQQSVDRNNAVLKTLLEQSLDAVNRMTQTVTGMEQSVQEAQANTNSRVDSLAVQVQSLRDTVDELTARLGQMSQQLAETQSVLQSVDARLAPGSPGVVAEGPPASSPGASSPSAPTTTAPPSADALYAAALRDFTSGKYDLARQQFEDYLTYYARTQLAGNAQYYIGETFYQQRDFRRAIGEYEKVVANYPNSYKIAAAHLKKGYALLELNQRSEGVRMLRTVLEKFPRSDEAKLARSRLQRLGEAGSR